MPASDVTDDLVVVVVVVHDELLEEEGDGNKDGANIAKVRDEVGKSRELDLKR